MGIEDIQHKENEINPNKKKIYQADYYELYFVLDVHKMIQQNGKDRFCDDAH